MKPSYMQLTTTRFFLKRLEHYGWAIHASVEVESLERAVEKFRELPHLERVLNNGGIVIPEAPLRTQFGDL